MYGALGLGVGRLDPSGGRSDEPGDGGDGGGSGFCLEDDDDACVVGWALV